MRNNPNNNVVSHKEIASKLKVSQSTVSRALDPAKSHMISPATRSKILEVANAMGFRSNIFARRMRNMKSETITFVIDDIRYHDHNSLDYIDFRAHGDAIGQEVVSGVIDAALECDMDVRLFPLSSSKARNIEKLSRHIGFPYSDGVLFFGFHYLKEFYNKVMKEGVPCLGVSVIDNDFPGASITVDPVSGVRSALRHLFKKGHTRIAYSTHQAVTSGYVSARYSGYELEMREAGYFDSGLLLMTPNEESIRIKSESKNLLDDFTAIVCMNDSMADRWRRELKYQGYRIPEDIAIVGCDNNPMFQGLSTIDLHAYELGYTAVKILDDAIKIDGELKSEVLEGGFIERASA